MYTALAGNSTYQGDGSSGIYVWGVQIEALPIISSYLPTGAAAIARAADVLSTAYVVAFSRR